MRPVELRSAGEATEVALEAIEAREHLVRAWAATDATQARRAADAVDRSKGAPLSGLAIGVKDVVDTVDFPTAYGSPIYEGFRPRRDAAAVALLREAGAVILGKTVTAPFALVGSGPTANPHKLDHTPGGSSMGSAAAVAAGMADAALGTQTAGSIVRPASFCGVFGFKPTFGSVSTVGVSVVAPSLDTVGWFARDVGTIDRLRTVLCDRKPMSEAPDAPRFAMAETEHWADLTADSRAMVEDAAGRAREGGARVGQARTPVEMTRLAAAQEMLMAYEARISLSSERLHHGGELPAVVAEYLRKATSVSAAERDSAIDRRCRALVALPDLFGEAEFLITAAALGEAPQGHASTGSPLAGRPWSLLGVPVLVVPWDRGRHGLPIAVQLVGRPGDDARLLAAGRWLARLSPFASEGAPIVAVERRQARTEPAR